MKGGFIIKDISDFEKIFYLKNLTYLETSGKLGAIHRSFHNIMEVPMPSMRVNLVLAGAPSSGYDQPLSRLGVSQMMLIADSLVLPKKPSLVISGTSRRCRQSTKELGVSPNIFWPAAGLPEYADWENKNVFLSEGEVTSVTKWVLPDCQSLLQTVKYGAVIVCDRTFVIQLIPDFVSLLTNRTFEEALETARLPQLLEGMVLNIKVDEQAIFDSMLDFDIKVLYSPAFSARTLIN